MPDFGRPLPEIPPSPLIAVEQLLRSFGHESPVPLHQGKTVFEPAARPRVWRREEFGIAAHEHAPPAGVPALRRAIAEQVGARRGTPVAPEQVIVTNGATHGVATVLNAVLRPGDEVLVLSPQWLFATGLIRAAGGVPREVPVFLELCQDEEFDFIAAIERAVGPRSRAVYFNNPNNPTGFRLAEPAVAALVELAERHDLWLIADNAYENYDFSPDGFVDTATVGRAAERTFSVHSCSKTYAMPGARVGYLVAPPGCTQVLTKWALHSVYSVATATQFAAFEALAGSADELAERRELAADAWQLVDDALEIPHTAVTGGLYTFLDLRALADPGDFVRRCAEAGVALAPGRAFGEHCAGWARICFTAAGPELVLDAVRRINKTYWEGIREH